MKLAILSDTQLPTDPAFSGHGLGQMVHMVASGLADCGHDVTLFAGVGSQFDKGKLIIKPNEADFLSHDLTAYDAVIDNTHPHYTGEISGLPAIQVSHDRQFKPTANAVFPSEAHRKWHGFNASDGRIVHNGVNIPDVSAFGKRRGGYVAYLSTFYREKQPHAALEAARLAGVKLVMAGSGAAQPPPGVTFVGPLSGVDKLEFLYHADALIYPASTECAPLTVLESLSVGTPVIVSAYGGASENMLPGVTGLVCHDTLEMVEALNAVSKLDRDTCRQWVIENRSAAQMVDGYDKLLNDVSKGARW